MKSRILFLLTLASTAYISHADTIHIVYPESSSTYQDIANKLGKRVVSWQKINGDKTDSVKISNSKSFPTIEIKK